MARFDLERIEGFMALADDIQVLRDRALADLIAAHDYFIDTTVAWNLVKRFATKRAFTIQNTTTGTKTSQTDLARKAGRYVKEQLAEATFQQFIAIFESFLFDFLRLWLTAYPRNLIGKKVDFKAILDAPDKETITLQVIDKELNEILYDKPAGWFAYLEDRAKLACPTVDEINRIAEAKASRDVLVHNRGVATRAYEAKAGILARCKERERIEITATYHREIWALLHKVIGDISNAAVAKVT
jgi:hypothetical protein